MCAASQSKRARATSVSPRRERLIRNAFGCNPVRVIVAFAEVSAAFRAQYGGESRGLRDAAYTIDAVFEFPVLHGATDLELIRAQVQRIADPPAARQQAQRRRLRCGERGRWRDGHDVRRRLGCCLGSRRRLLRRLFFRARGRLAHHERWRRRVGLRCDCDHVAWRRGVALHRPRLRGRCGRWGCDRSDRFGRRREARNQRRRRDRSLWHPDVRAGNHHGVQRRGQSNRGDQRPQRSPRNHGLEPLT